MSDFAGQDHCLGSIVSDVLANLIAKKFIQRRDVKAIQHSDGSWSPHTKTGKREGERLPWTRPDLLSHVQGQRTFGHYLLDSDSLCKLFAFDIDLEKNNPEKGFVGYYEDWNGAKIEMDPREAWQDRAHPGRPYMKEQFRVISHKLMRAITEELDLPCAAAYSGGKGVHVYAFTGTIPAVEARDGAQIILDAVGGFTATRGTNFFQHEAFHNLSVEVFPKQGSLDGKDLGNLMRLPLGRNLKSKDPTFFMDMCAPMAEMRPLDPAFALTTATPWLRPGE